MDNLDILKRDFSERHLNDFISENTNIIGLVESLFFWDKWCRDYRQSTIEYCKNKLGWFRSSCNTVYESVDKFVKIRCPYCGKNMEHKDGGGNGERHTSNYICKCGTKFSLSIQPDGIWFKKGEK